MSELWREHDVMDDYDAAEFCAACDALVVGGQFYGEFDDLCYSCGLRGCVDDLCHGQGWCMHE